MMRIELLRLPGKSTAVFERATRGPALIEGLRLSTRAYHLLRHAGCRTVDDVLAKWPDSILRTHGAGHVFAREVWESLRRVVPHLSSVLPPNTVRKRVSVQVPYSRDQNTFLNNARAKWKACVQEDKDRQSAPRKRKERSSDEEGSVESKDFEFLRMCMRGMTAGQIGQKRNCDSKAVYTIKRRLVLRYVHPNRLQQVPKDLQHFIVSTSENYLKHVSTPRGNHESRINHGCSNDRISLSNGIDGL